MNRTDLYKALEERGLSGYIITGTDPHSSEYVAPWWETRAWVSGFTGSAGVVCVRKTTQGWETALWSDSRYYLQAEAQLAGTDIAFFHLGEDSWQDWVGAAAPLSAEAAKIGVDGRTLGTKAALYTQDILARYNAELVDTEGIFETLWTDRPTDPLNPTYGVDPAICGADLKERLAQLRAQVQALGAVATLTTDLADIAWITLRRGNDISYNPVFYAYMLIGMDYAYLYTDERKFDAGAIADLKAAGVSIKPYEAYWADIAQDLDGAIVVDPAKLCWRSAQSIKGRRIEMIHPISQAKMVKTPEEQKAMRAGQELDGLAVVRFLHWLNNELKDPSKHEALTELSLGERVKEFRALADEFLGESFASIVGLGPHGAIVHYKAEKDTDVPIQGPTLMVLDTGGQYPGCTTDITRTIVIPNTSDPEKFDDPIDLEMARDYTTVLKAHIQVALAEFPAGTRGYQIDAYARKELWNQHKNYGHGTGHGVGFGLNVHEGPVSISSGPIDVKLEPGMCVSNEPGLYLKDRYGIRHESCVFVEERAQNEFGAWYGFETITYCPFEPRAIIVEMLTEEELAWLNAYHEEVRNRLAPYLTDEPDTLMWLFDQTAELS